MAQISGLFNRIVRKPSVRNISFRLNVRPIVEPRDEKISPVLPSGAYEHAAAIWSQASVLGDDPINSAQRHSLRIASEGGYVGDSSSDWLDQADYSGIRDRIKEERIEGRLTNGHRFNVSAKNREWMLITHVIKSRTFLIPEDAPELLDLFYKNSRFRKGLENDISRGQALENLRVDEPYLFLSVSHILSQEKDDNGNRIDHLGGDHIGDDTFLVHDALFSHRNSTGVIADGIVAKHNNALEGSGTLLIEGIVHHELDHEATPGQDRYNQTIENMMLPLDVERMVRSARGRGIDLDRLQRNLATFGHVSTAFLSRFDQERSKQPLARTRSSQYSDELRRSAGFWRFVFILGIATVFFILNYIVNQAVLDSVDGLALLQLGNGVIVVAVALVVIVLSAIAGFFIKGRGLTIAAGLLIGGVASQLIDISLDNGFVRLIPFVGLSFAHLVIWLGSLAAAIFVAVRGAPWLLSKVFPSSQNRFSMPIGIVAALIIFTLIPFVTNAYHPSVTSLGELLTDRQEQVVRLSDLSPDQRDQFAGNLFTSATNSGVVIAAQVPDEAVLRSEDAPPLARTTVSVNIDSRLRDQLGGAAIIEVPVEGEINGFNLINALINRFSEYTVLRKLSPYPSEIVIIVDGFERTAATVSHPIPPNSNITLAPTSRFTANESPRPIEVPNEVFVQNSITVKIDRSLVDEIGFESVVLQLSGENVKNTELLHVLSEKSDKIKEGLESGRIMLTIYGVPILGGNSNSGVSISPRAQASTSRPFDPMVVPNPNYKPIVVAPPAGVPPTPSPQTPGAPVVSPTPNTGVPTPVTQPPVAQRTPVNVDPALQQRFGLPAQLHLSLPASTSPGNIIDLIAKEVFKNNKAAEERFRNAAAEGQIMVEHAGDTWVAPRLNRTLLPRPGVDFKLLPVDSSGLHFAQKPDVVVASIDALKEEALSWP